MNQYNAAAWLLDRQLDAGHGDRIAYRIDGRSVSYANATRYGGPRTPCVSSTCAGERWRWSSTTSWRSRPGSRRSARGRSLCRCRPC